MICSVRSRAFSDGGQLQRQEDNFGVSTATIAHDFDRYGNLTELRQGDLKYRFDYDPSGALATIHGPAGKIELQRDEFGRVDRIGSLEVRLDPSGRPFSMGADSLKNQFDYDALGRLVRVHSPTGLIQHEYTAEGLHIASRFADEMRMTVPDPLKLSSGPLLTSGPGFVETQPFSDMTVRFQGIQAQLSWHDLTGNPFGRVSVNLKTQDFSSFERISTPRIERPDLQQLRGLESPLSSFPAPQMPRFEDFSRAPQDPIADVQRRAMLGDRSAQMVWDLLSQPNYAPTDPVARDRYWSSGEYWHKDPYYRGLAAEGIRPGASREYDWMFNPDEFVRAWFLNLGATGMNFAGALSSAFRGPGAGIVERASDLAWHKITSAMPPQFRQAQEQMRGGVDEFRSITGLAKSLYGLTDLAENISNFFEPHIHHRGLTTTIGTIDDYHLRNGRFIPTERQYQWLPQIDVTVGINWGNVGDFIAKNLANQAKGRVFDEIQGYLQRPSTLGRSEDFASSLEDAVFDPLMPLGLQPKGVKFDKPAEFYGKLGAIRGIHFDPQTKRLALLGDGNPSLPPLRLDDFATAVRVVYGHHPGGPNDPTFSLDPADPDNPAGDWLRPVYLPGLLEITHMGDVMLRADWVLKQYAFGVFADYDGVIRGKRVSSVPGFQSYLERLKSTPELLAEGEVCSRFWILPLEMKLEQQGGTLVFSRATMQVRTQRMENVGGRLEDKPDSSDQAANLFAAHFTDNYDRFAAEAPVLEEVRQAAKVVAIVKWLKERGVGVNDFDIDWKQAAGPPKATGHGSTPIRSLSVTESVALWGLRPTVVRIVGGVRLSPQPITVRAAVTGSLDRNLTTAMTGPAATAAGQVTERIGTQSRRFLAATVPITLSGRDFVRQHPVYEQDGLTYALDGRQCIRTVMDGRGNVAAYDYDEQRRLVAYRYHNAGDWQLDAGLTDGGGRAFSVRSPKGDRVQYRYGDDGRLSEASINGRTVVRRAASADPAVVKFEYLEEAEHWPIGHLGGPKKADQIVATEEIVQRDGEVRYERRQPGRNAEYVSCKFSDNSVTVEGSSIAKTHLHQPDRNTVVETGAQGRIEYRFDPDSGRLRRIAFENGDFAELASGESAPGGAAAVFRTQRGSATAEVRMAGDRLSVRDLAGNETAYEYRQGVLQTIQSPWGTTRYRYTPDEKHVAAIHYPDKTVQRYQWHEGPGMKRVTTWWETERN